MTGVMSTPVPSPSMYGMTGLSGAAIDKSLFTRIFSPPEGTLMCLYAMDFPRSGRCWIGVRRVRCVERGLIIYSLPARYVIDLENNSASQQNFRVSRTSTRYRDPRYRGWTGRCRLFPNHSREGDENEAVHFGAGRGDLRCRERYRRRAGKEGGREIADGQEGQQEELRQEVVRQEVVRQERRWQEERRSQEVTRLKYQGEARPRPCLFHLCAPLSLFSHSPRRRPQPSTPSLSSTPACTSSRPRWSPSPGPAPRASCTARAWRRTPGCCSSSTSRRPIACG